MLLNPTTRALRAHGISEQELLGLSSGPQGTAPAGEKTVSSAAAHDDFLQHAPSTEGSPCKQPGSSIHAAGTSAPKARKHPAPGALADAAAAGGDARPSAIKVCQEGSWHLLHSRCGFILSIYNCKLSRAL